MNIWLYDIYIYILYYLYIHSKPSNLGVPTDLTCRLIDGYTPTRWWKSCFFLVETPSTGAQIRSFQDDMPCFLAKIFLSSTGWDASFNRVKSHESLSPLQQKCASLQMSFMTCQSCICNGHPSDVSWKTQISDIYGYLTIKMGNLPKFKGWANQEDQQELETRKQTWGSNQQTSQTCDDTIYCWAWPG